MPDETPKSVQLRMPPNIAALVESSIPKIYANGFSLGLTNADAQLVLILFGRPIAVLSFSYTLAKTLSEKLSILVKEWENRTGSTLQTTDMIDKVFGKDAQKEPPK